MTARNAWKKARKTLREHRGESMSFLLLETVLRLIVLCPLLALLTTNMKWLALFTPLLFILIILPARQKAAAVMQDSLRGQSLFSARLILGGSYGKALGAGLKQLLIMLLWFLPCIAATIYLYYMYSGGADAFTVLRMVSALGGKDIVKGFVIIGIIYACTLLIGIFGLAFHSGRRHELALTGRVIKGHRGLILRSWLMGLLTVIPFAIAFALLSADYFAALKEAIQTFMKVMKLTLPPLGAKAWYIAGAAVVLLLPVLPFRSLITASAVHGLWEGDKE